MGDLVKVEGLDLENFLTRFGSPEFEGHTMFEFFVDKRFNQAYNSIMEFHEEEVKAAQVVIICVTHFTGVNIFDMGMVGSPEDNIKIPAPFYCCVS